MRSKSNIFFFSQNWLVSWYSVNYCILLAMEMAFWRFVNAFSYLKNPINQKSKLSSVTTSMYFFAGSLTFSLWLALLIFFNGIKTCRRSHNTAGSNLCCQRVSLACMKDMFGSDFGMTRITLVMHFFSDFGPNKSKHVITGW